MSQLRSGSGALDGVRRRPAQEGRQLGPFKQVQQANSQEVMATTECARESSGGGVPHLTNVDKTLKSAASSRTTDISTWSALANVGALRDLGTMQTAQVTCVEQLTLSSDDEGWENKDEGCDCHSQQDTEDRTVDSYAYSEDETSDDPSDETYVCSDSEAHSADANEDNNEELLELTKLRTAVKGLQRELARRGQEAEMLRRKRKHLERRLEAAHAKAADLKREDAGKGDGLCARCRQYLLETSRAVSYMNTQRAAFFTHATVAIRGY